MTLLARASPAFGFLRYCLLTATDQLILMVQRRVADLWRQASDLFADGRRANVIPAGVMLDLLEAIIGPVGLDAVAAAARLHLGKNAFAEALGDDFRRSEADLKASVHGVIVGARPLDCKTVACFRSYFADHNSKSASLMALSFISSAATQAARMMRIFSSSTSLASASRKLSGSFEIIAGKTVSERSTSVSVVKGDVYLLDEPTTGLHLADVEQLLGLLDRLVDSGKSVIVIAHHQAVMAHADWIIDLGPGAGHDGGRIVFEGTPADLVAARSTLTGEHLAAYVGS
jgi:hypothetical protein